MTDLLHFLLELLKEVFGIKCLQNESVFIKASNSVADFLAVTKDSYSSVIALCMSLIYLLQAEFEVVP